MDAPSESKSALLAQMSEAPSVLQTSLLAQMLEAPSVLQSEPMSETRLARPSEQTWEAPSDLKSEPLSVQVLETLSALRQGPVTAPMSALQ